MFTKKLIANVSITATGWTEVDLGSEIVGTALIQCRTNVAILIGDDTTYFTLKAGAVLEWDVKELGDPIFLARSSSGTVVLEVFAIECKY